MQACGKILSHQISRSLWCSERRPMSSSLWWRWPKAARAGDRREPAATSWSGVLSAAATTAEDTSAPSALLSVSVIICDMLQPLHEGEGEGEGEGEWRALSTCYTCPGDTEVSNVFRQCIKRLQNVLVYWSIICFLYRRFPTCLPLLYSLCQYSELVGTEELTHEKMIEVLPMLHRNLSSPSSSVSALVRLNNIIRPCNRANPEIKCKAIAVVSTSF